jgi:hypothetical protein
MRECGRFGSHTFKGMGRATDREARSFWRSSDSELSTSFAAPFALRAKRLQKPGGASVISVGVSPFGEGNLEALYSPSRNLFFVKSARVSTS